MVWVLDMSAGGGYNIYYNSISLATNQTIAGSPVCLYIGSGITTAASVTIKNNALSNTTTTGTPYAESLQQQYQQH
jgi:hypothetical protein